MKVVAEVFSRSEEDRITSLLHSKGIPTISNGNGGFRRQFHKLIFVCLDEQFHDAEMIVKWPSHTPKVQVDVDAFFRRSNRSNLDTILGWLTAGVVVFALLLFIAFQVSKHYGTST